MEHYHNYNDGSGPRRLEHDHPYTEQHWHPDPTSVEHYPLSERPQQVDIATVALNDFGALSGFYGVWVTCTMLVMAWFAGSMVGGDTGAAFALTIAIVLLAQGWSNGKRQKEALRGNQHS